MYSTCGLHQMQIKRKKETYNNRRQTNLRYKVSSSLTDLNDDDGSKDLKKSMNSPGK